MHLGCLAAFFTPVTWNLVLLCLVLYLVRMFGLTAGYHRYFSHRSYETSRAFQCVLALLGLLAMENGPLWWAAHHRRHHKFSDREGDLHSPGLRGFFAAHMGWILSIDHGAAELERVRDFSVYPELVWLDRHDRWPGLTLGLVLFLWGGLPALVWGFFISTVMTWHVTFAINSVAHMTGSRRFATGDESRNNFLLAMFTLGDGWHNNHHFCPRSSRHGFTWWEIDPCYYALRACERLGLIWELREPPLEIMTPHPMTARGS